MKDERNLVIDVGGAQGGNKKARAPRRPAKGAIGRRRDGDQDRGIPFVLARLFLLGCALVLIGAVGDLLVIICKWIGGAIILFVICGTVIRLVFEKWPEWVVRPCQKISAWLER